MATTKHYLTTAFLAAATILTIHEMSGCSKKSSEPAPTVASMPAANGGKQPDCNPPAPPPPPAPPATLKTGHTGKHPRRTPTVVVAKNKKPKADRAAPEQAASIGRPDPVIRYTDQPPNTNGGSAGGNNQPGSNADLPPDAAVRTSNVLPDRGPAVALYVGAVGGYGWIADGRGGYRRDPKVIIVKPEPVRGPINNPPRSGPRPLKAYDRINGKLDNRGAKMAAGARQPSNAGRTGVHSAGGPSFGGGKKH